MAAVLVHNEHTKEELNNAYENTSLLSHPNKLFIAIRDIQKTLEGCYLHFDTVDHVFARSERAAGLDQSDPRCEFQNQDASHYCKAPETNILIV